MSAANENGLLYFWENLEDHPKCPHGPTLLFGKYIDGQLKKFYACSALRESGLCTSFVHPNEKVTKHHFIKTKWKNVLPFYNHKKLYLRFNELMSTEPINRIYCHTCNELILSSEENKHKIHDLKKCLTNYEMTHPTEFLKPLNNTKREAQYFFSEKTTHDLVQILLKLKAKRILCIGVPRLYEYILHNFGNEMTCFLLDFDGRFHNFLGPLDFAWYNLFNNYFFSHESQKILKDFITQGSGKDVYLVCDPPFGGRVEPISQTIKNISDCHKKWNNLKSIDDELKVMFIFPYFMESLMKLKSNPPGINGGLSDLKMTDYKVKYDNHPKFQEKLISSKKISPVRLFTNVKLSSINLLELGDYKYCTICERWVAFENNHCHKCNQCTSKDGRQYKHCDLCKRCVKQSWEHCIVCKRCTFGKHDLHQQLRIVGNCFHCNQTGHTKKDCQNKDYIFPQLMENNFPRKKKRKLNR